MTQVQISTSNSRFDKYVCKELQWRPFAVAAFRVIGAIKDAEARKRFDGRGHLLIDRNSNYARTFADLLVEKLSSTAESISCSLCALTTDIIYYLPGGALTPKNLSVVFGFVDINNRISPIVFSHKFFLIQKADDSIFSSVYDESTNIAGIVNAMCIVAPADWWLRPPAFDLISVPFGLRFE